MIASLDHFLTKPYDSNLIDSKISQPSSINKEYYKNENFMKAYKTFIKTIITYLNTTIEDPTSQINDIIELSHSLAKVI